MSRSAGDRRRVGRPSLWRLPHAATAELICSTASRLGCEDEHVDAGGPAGLLGDAAHLGAEGEVDPIELEQAVARVVQLLARLLVPARVGEVTTREQVYALDLGPASKALEGELPAGPAGVG